MLDDNLRRLEGRKGLVIGIANDQSIAYGCAKAFRAFGAELAVTYLNDKAKRFVEPLAQTAGSAPVPATRCPGRWPARSGVRGDRATVGQARLRPALDRLRPARRPARPGGRLLARRLFAGHGRVLPLLHPHGPPGRAPDEGRRRPVHHELLRRRKSGRELQPDGPGQSRPGSLRPLPRRRTRPQRHPRPRHLTQAPSRPAPRRASPTSTTSSTKPPPAPPPAAWSPSKTSASPPQPSPPTPPN